MIKHLTIKYSLIVLLGFLHTTEIHSTKITEKLPIALSHINEEYHLTDYSFLPQALEDLDVNTDNDAVNLLTQIGDALLINAQNYFFNPANFKYKSIPKIKAKKALAFESTKVCTYLHSYDTKINFAVNVILKASLEYYKAAIKISDDKEFQQDLINQFNFIIAEMRYFVSKISKDTYKKKYINLIANYESDLDAFKIKNNFLSIKSAPSLNLNDNNS